MKATKGDRNKQAATFATFAAPDVARVFAPSASAERCVAGFEMGQRREVLTKGQFSLLDMVRALLELTGPASVRLSTWSTGIRDAETAAWMLSSGLLTSLQLLTDRSFPARQPKYAGRLVALFGEDAIVCTRVHAKVAIIESDDWSIAIRSSMNLNRNPRFEQASIDGDAEMVAFYGAWFDELEARAPRGFDFEEAEVQAAFEAALQGGIDESMGAVESMTGKRPRWGQMAAAPKGQRARVQGGEVAASVLDLVDEDDEDVAAWLMRAAQAGVAGAEPGSVAYCQSLRAVRDAHAALREMRAAAAQRGGIAPEEMTPDEWRQRIETDARSASLEDLEVYVREYYDRSSLEPVAEDGVIRLVRVAR